MRFRFGLSHHFGRLGRAIAAIVGGGGGQTLAERLTELGAVAFWPLDEGSGTTAADIIGGADGTLNGATWGTELVAGAGSAASFDGTSWVDIDNFDSSVLGENWSVELTVEDPTAQTTGPEYWFHLSNANSDTVRIGATTPNTFILGDYSVNGNQLQSTSFQKTSGYAGVTHHIVLTRSGNTARLYVDGVERDIHTDAGTITWTGGNWRATIGAARRTDETTLSSPSISRVSHVGIYNRELTADEVNERYLFRDTAPTAFQQALLDLGAVAFWPLDEGSGTVATDIIGGADGTLNGATWGTELVTSAGAAASFDGIDDFIDISAIDWVNLFDNTQFSLEVTFSPASATANRKELVRLPRLGSGGGGGQSIQTLNNTLTGYTVHDPSNTTEDTDIISQGLSAGSVHHVIFTWSTTNGGKLYRNGDLKVTDTAGTILNNQAVPAATTYASIGNRNHSTAPEYYFDGRISHVGIYNRELTAAEVTDRYNYRDRVPTLAERLTTLGAVAFWPLTSDANDIIGTADGVVNGATIGTELVADTGGAYQFDGVDDYIDIGAFDNTVLDGLSGLSLEATIQTTAWPNHIMSLFRGAGAKVAGMIASLEVPTDGIGFSLRPQSLATDDGFDSNTPNLTTATFHVMLTWDQATATAKLYLDGVLEVTLTPGNDLGSLMVSDVNVSAHVIGAGRTSNLPTGNLADFFTGRISHVGIYNRELTANEVLDRYNNRT